MRRLMLVAATAAATLAVIGGCGPRRWLIWQVRPPAAQVQGRMSIAVADHREEGKGGKDPRQIGVEPQNNGFTGLIPLPLKLRTPTEVSDSLRELLADAAISSGIGVAPPNDPTVTSKLSVEVQTFWCTGFPPVLKVNIAASAILLGPDGAVRVAGAPLQAEAASTYCQGAYAKALNMLYANAQSLMASPQFHDAAVSAAAQAAPPPPPPAQ